MAHNISPFGSQEKDKRVSRYECPADFVPLQYSCSEKSVLDRGENTELWLIKAPARFNPSSLADFKVSLSGLEMIQPTEASPQIYSVLSSRSGPADLHLLTASGQKQNAALCPSGFTGILSISESYVDCSTNQNPIPIPAAPAPSFPPGLKQRFQPFGSSIATPIFQTTSASLLPPKKLKLESDTEDQRKKKKKKKKEKHSREESVKVTPIKQEEIPYKCSELQVPEPVEEETAERKKKKKFKKEKEAKGTQDEMAVDASLIAKQEPVDTSFDDIESSVKKKKKKKKKKKAQDE